ncbi:hypothetical protein CDAR_252301 [Caerostris darwini]|uniref:Uncharacterized protein n=1 Tax=Caerostris darwini TaxID=1538125 RepID=A0AAV4Q9U1_9ARAC|nr:hypothetical protein CDAR_252301 [Caerostris darwini]
MGAGGWNRDIMKGVEGMEGMLPRNATRRENFSKIARFQKREFDKCPTAWDVGTQPNLGSSHHFLRPFQFYPFYSLSPCPRLAATFPPSRKNAKNVANIPTPRPDSSVSSFTPFSHTSPTCLANMTHPFPKRHLLAPLRHSSRQRLQFFHFSYLRKPLRTNYQTA